MLTETRGQSVTKYLIFPQSVQQQDTQEKIVMKFRTAIYSTSENGRSEIKKDIKNNPTILNFVMTIYKKAKEAELEYEILGVKFYNKLKKRS